MKIWSNISVKAKSLTCRQQFYPIAALCIGICLAVMLSSTKVAAVLYEHISWRATDLLVRYAGDAAVDPRVAIIAINDKTLSTQDGYGQRLENWDRRLYAQLIERLEKAGARAAIIDILFLGEDKGDALFSQALSESSMPVILAVGQADETDSLAKPTEQLYQAVKQVGHANVEIDQDLVVRRVQSTIADDGVSVPPLGLAAASAYWRLPADIPIADSVVKGYLPNGVALPTDSQQNFRINFTQPQAYVACELASYLEAKIGGCSDIMLRDKIVFVGWTLADGNDYYATPVGPMSGVEIHANLAASLLTDSLLEEQQPWLRYLILIIFALLSGYLYATKRVLVIVSAQLLLALSIVGLGLIAFQFFKIRADIIGPLSAMLVVNAVLGTVQNMVHRKEKSMVLELFKNQTSPQIVNALLDAAENGTLDLGGKERPVSIVFFDMRNFTKISEYLTPPEVVEVINTYLSIITECLIEKGGTLTNYAGDQVMAIFNAPLPLPNHAEKAIRAAQYTMDKIEAFNQTPEADALPVKAHFGAGVESGNVIAGNIGSLKHHSYTAIGDAVNVAARLCDLAPASTLFIGGNATSLASDQTVRDLVVMGGRHLKGRQGTVQIYRSDHAMQPVPSTVPAQSASPKRFPTQQPKPMIRQTVAAPVMGR